MIPAQRLRIALKIGVSWLYGKSHDAETVLSVLSSVNNLGALRITHKHHLA